jgi:hypothetical protein
MNCTFTGHRLRIQKREQMRYVWFLHVFNLITFWVYYLISSDIQTRSSILLKGRILRQCIFETTDMVNDNSDRCQHRQPHQEEPVFCITKCPKTLIYQWQTSMAWCSNGLNLNDTRNLKYHQMKIIKIIKSNREIVESGG